MKSYQAIVLVAHEPKRDPRIDWVSTSLSKRWSTLVLGVNQNANEVYSESYDLKKISGDKVSIAGLLFFIKTLIKATSHYGFLKSIAYSLSIFFVLPLGAIFLAFKKILFWTKMTSVLDGVKKLPFGVNFLKHVFLMSWIVGHVIRFASSLMKENINDEELKYVYANDLDTLLGGIYLKTKKPSIKLIYDNHEFYPFQFKNSPHWFDSLLLLLEDFLIKNVDEFIIVTPGLAERFKHLHKLNKDVVVLPNFSPLDGLECKKHLNEKLVFLFQGGFAPGRGVERLIEFWSKINSKDCKLLLRGPDNEFKAQYIQIADKLGLYNQCVFFPPAVTEDELIAEACLADVGVIPYEPININNKFCCPNKLSQYLQAGLAILSNDLVFVKESIDKYQCGAYYSSDSFESFSLAISKLISDKQKLIEIKKRSQLAAQEYFNWNTCEEILLSLVAK